MASEHYGHYTSFDGFMGIIRTETLRATNIKFLNDEQEFQHALQLIKTRIRKPKKITPGHEDYVTFQQFVKAVDDELDSLDNYQSESIYTCSFSKELDLLSQWRGYCPENNGLCIGFDLGQVFTHAQTQYPQAQLQECIYDDASKDAQIKRLLNKHWPKYRAASEKKAKTVVVDQVGRDAMLIASHFKHSSFSEEREKRLVITLDYAPDDPNLKFRAGRFSLIPYIELQVPRKSVSTICIGPTANRELSKRALSMFLEHIFGNPFNVPGVVFSKTPYRPW